jgi:murein DD-endopeptidase MepM/ murein hydrolase activator NlpD
MNYARMLHPTRWIFAATLLASCVSGNVAPRDENGVRLQVGLPPALPDTSGWGVHVLTLARGWDGALWAGTYGRGIYVLRPDSTTWEHIDTGENGLSWGFVNSIAPMTDSTIWYGTVGNGFGVSVDAGRTWHNWTLDELGKEWQYVALEGIRTRGDTVYIATADGLRISGDAGATWRCVIPMANAPGSTGRLDHGCNERIEALPNEYLLSIDVGIDGTIRVGSLAGLSVSADAGRTWSHLDDSAGAPGGRIRGVVTNGDSIIWFVDEMNAYVDSAGDGTFTQASIVLPGWDGLPGAPRGIAASPAPMLPSIPTSFGLAASTDDDVYRLYYLSAAERYRPAGDVWAITWWGPPYWPLGATSAGMSRVLAGESPVPALVDARAAAAPAAPRRPWLARPIADDNANPYIDQTYRYGSTMGGNFQQHQGIEFNNPAGTPVRAIASGTVAFAGPAEAGANTVAILHDARDGDRHVFSTYYHNTELRVAVGERVSAGDVVALVGNTGRATNDHLHLEVHAAPGDDVTAVVDPNNRYPAYTVNPQLWIEPAPGTGAVAGRAVDAAGQPVAGAHIFGLVVAYPAETPFSFAETYEDRAHPDPLYNENFAVGDVPAGSYLVGVELEGRRVWRRVTVRAGQVTWVEFQP